MSHPVYSQEKSSWHLNRRLCGPHSYSGHFGKQKISGPYQKSIHDSFTVPAHSKLSKYTDNTKIIPQQVIKLKLILYNYLILAT